MILDVAICITITLAVMCVLSTVCVLAAVYTSCRSDKRRREDIDRAVGNIREIKERRDV